MGGEDGARRGWMHVCVCVQGFWYGCVGRQGGEEEIGRGGNEWPEGRETGIVWPAVGLDSTSL